MLELTLRLVASLALVVGLMLVMVRIGGRRFQGRADAPLRVVHRQALSRGSAVAVVEVGGRMLVVGTTDHQVSMLTELAPGDLDGDLGRDLGGDEREQPAAPATRAAFASHLDSAVRELHVVPEAAQEPLETEPETLAPTGTEVASPARSPRGGAHAARRTDRPTGRTRAGSQPRTAGPLAGSVLSPATWKQAVAATRGRR